MRSLKILVAFLGAAIVALLPSCSTPAATTSVSATTPPARVSTVRLIGTIGPMTIPMAYMVEHNSLSSVAKNTTLDIWANPTQLQAIVTSGQGDFIAVPTNSAALYYNRGISLKMLDCSVWNILYLVTTDSSIKSVADLRGKRIVVPYQGAVPDALFRVVLQKQGIDPLKDVDIFYAPDPVQGAQLLLSGTEKYALLSEPSATSVIIKGQSIGKTFVRALNMKSEWDKGFGQGNSTPIAGTIVIGSLKDRPDVVSAFLTEYEKAVQWMLANPADAGALGAKYLAQQGFNAAVLTQSLQSTDWNFVPAQTAKPDLEAFFTALAVQSPDFIGGKLPDDGFYYKK